MRALSLFSGIGGIEIAGNACGIETVALCEVEPYACKVLGKRFPGVPNVGDITRFTSAPLHEFGGSPFVSWKTPEDIGYVDLVYGGFPCQDLSVAGKQKGLKDEDGKNTRSGLWYEMLRVVETLRPAWVLAENVRGAIRIALDVVSSGLENAGYEIRPYVIPASATGAPHKRERLFVVGTRRDVVKDCLNAIRRIENDGLNIEEMVIAVMGNCFNLAFQTGNFESGDTPDSKRTVGKWRSDSVPQGSINPEWVENLMGFPLGWTDVECDKPDLWPGWPAMMEENVMWRTPARQDSGISVARLTGKPGARMYDKKTGRLAQYGLAQQLTIVDDMGSTQYLYEPPRICPKSPNRTNRLKALGNAVVPNQIFPLLSAIASMHELTETIRKGERS